MCFSYSLAYMMRQGKKSGTFRGLEKDKDSLQSGIQLKLVCFEKREFQHGYQLLNTLISAIHLKFSRKFT